MRVKHEACRRVGTLRMVAIVIIILSIITIIVITCLNPFLLPFFLPMQTTDLQTDSSPWCLLGLDFCFPTALGLSYSYPAVRKYSVL